MQLLHTYDRGAFWGVFSGRTFKHDIVRSLSVSVLFCFNAWTLHVFEIFLEDPRSHKLYVFNALYIALVSKLKEGTFFGPPKPDFLQRPRTVFLSTPPVNAVLQPPTCCFDRTCLFDPLTFHYHPSTPQTWPGYFFNPPTRAKGKPPRKTEGKSKESSR